MLIARQAKNAHLQPTRFAWHSGKGKSDLRTRMPRSSRSEEEDTLRFTAFSLAALLSALPMGAYAHPVGFPPPEPTRSANLLEAAVHCGHDAHYVRGHRAKDGHYVKGHCVRIHH
jgi:hypothetical protein